MAPFVEKYTQRQRDALAHAYADRNIRPAARVVAMAKAGELTCDGETLEPFEVGADYIRDLARKLARRRRGETTSKLADAEPRDAIEQLRRRLVNAADAMLTVEERKQAAAMDPERLRQIIRCVREAAAIPGPRDPRPKPPGAKEGGARTQPEGETRGGLAGGILAAHRQEGSTAPSPPTHARDSGDRDDTTLSVETGAMAETDSAAHDVDEHSSDDDSPGSLARELAASHLRA